MFGQLLASLRPACANNGTRRKTSLAVEALEDRQLLSATAVLGADNVLRVTGSGAAETIVIDKAASSIRVFDNGSAVSIRLPDGGSAATLDSARCRSIAVSALGGNDTVRVRDGSATAANAAIAVSIDGGFGHDKLYGGRANDTLSGSFGNDVLEGGVGSDTLQGGFDNDFLRGGAGNDTLRGSFGNDTLYGGDGNDQLYGGFDNDGLFGGGGFDNLYGEGGADRLLLWHSYPSDLAYTVVHAREAIDAEIIFSDTYAPNVVTTTLKVNGQATNQQLTYAAASWTPAQIEKIDVSLKWLHEQTNNARLLKTKTGTPISFKRFGSYVPRNATDGINDAADLVANANGPTFDAWNRGSGSLAITQTGITLSQNGLNDTVLHEVGHNWDTEESNTWSAWLNLSGWTPAPAGAPVPFGKQRSGNGAWFHNSSAQFYRAYSRWSPQEDLATTWEAYYRWKKGTLPSADVTRLTAKLNYVDALFSRLRS